MGCFKNNSYYFYLLKELESIKINSMKKFITILLFLPLISTAQTNGPRFVNDTLYTSSGYKIYKGLTLHFGTGTRTNGKFRFVNIKTDIASASLTNNFIVVKKMKNYGISVLGNGYITIIGTIKYKDGSKGSVDIHMAFDRAIENSPNLPSELIVPDEYRNKKLLSVADEIKKLNNLYEDGIITKEEFDIQKKKLLDR
jgi:Short C-terminal domain